MRSVIWLVLLAVAAVVAATAFGGNDGLVSLYWSGWRVDLPLLGLVGGVLGALLVGAVAGVHPASRAARLAPADAVRPR